MNGRLMLIFAGISGFFCIAFSIISSNLLLPLLNYDQRECIYVGLYYQSIHTLVLMILSIILLHKIILIFYWVGIFFSIGILLSSGSFYCISLLQIKHLIYFIPVGFFCFLIGWILIVIAAIRFKKSYNIS